MILQNTSATIKVQLLVDGVGTDPTPDSATVTIYRENGTVLVAETAATGGADGLFTFQLTPTETVQLDSLRAYWKMSLGGDEQTITTFHEIAGGFICTLGAISAAITAAGGTSPDADELREKRTDAERRIEDASNVAFRPRYAREKLDGNGRDELFVTRPRALAPIAVAIGGTALTENELADLEPTAAGFYREGRWPVGRRNIEITYSHGWPAPPEPITRAAIQLAAAYVQATGGSDGITRFREDGQEVWLSVPGVNGATGIPDVDQAIRDYRYPTVG